MKRRNFLSLLTLPLIIQIPQEFLLRNGDLIEVYYSDTGTFGDPWKPQWIKCVVDNDKCRWLDNNHYFSKDWMIDHYYWKYADKPNKIFKPRKHFIK